MITVACCLWGDFPAPGWGAEYVRRLQRGVARNLTVPHRFVCFTNEPVSGVDCRGLVPRHWRGNLPKTYVYSPLAALEGQVLLFDLDNVIVGPIDAMAAFQGPLCVRGRFGPVIRGGRRLPDGDMISFRAGSDEAVALWRASERLDAINKSRNGREREFILSVAPHANQWQDICPGLIVSYRLECLKRGGLPPGASVVSMHGKPRPHEVTDSYIVENWQ